MTDTKNPHVREIQIQLNGTRYVWRPSPFPLQILYGAPVILASLIPDGLVLTLRNVRGERLVIRGEPFGEGIAFFHLCGEGGNRLIGEWVAMTVEKEPAWAAKLRASFAETLRGSK